MDRYEMTWNNPTEKVKVGEVEFFLPDVPPEKDMFNYEKGIKDQKYSRTVLPPDIYKWEKNKIDAYVEHQWHRRKHGEWWIIKGHPLYIPGSALTFFDFWTTEDNNRPDFRIAALEAFWFWYLYVDRDPDLFGAYVVKARRMGITEDFLFICWDRTTRFLNSRCGLQADEDATASRNFERLRTGNNGMPFFFLPRRSGSDSEELNFGPPNEVITNKKFRESIGKIEETADNSIFLNSYINYEATVDGKYDSRKLFTYYLDEVLKIKVGRMDVKKQWNNIRKVTSLNNEMLIYGKSILTSTVEEKNDKNNDNYEQTVEVARYLWDNSDSLNRDSNNRTYTGLARLFLSYEYSAATDEYGFHKVAEARKFRQNKLNEFLKKGDYDAVIDLYRKEPETIEEALSDFSADCPLHPEKCEARVNQIKNGLDRYNQPIPNYVPRVLEYELVWKGGIPYTEVEAVQKKGGAWHISQMPRFPNHVGTKEYQGRRIYIPLAGAFYSMGCDPYDAEVTIRKGSDGAFIVKRSLDLLSETDVEFDATGRVVNPEKLKTNKIVCDYRHRPKHPYDFYMDVVKTCWFYGVPVFPELDKRGLVTWMSNEGLKAFIQQEPRALMALISRKKAGLGTVATETVITTYIELLISYIGHYWPAIDHPRVLKDCSPFRRETRTKHDLAVAFGYTELADMDKNPKLQEKKEEEKESWGHGLYEIHQPQSN